jgi:hypothetical protein
VALEHGVEVDSVSTWPDLRFRARRPRRRHEQRRCLHRWTPTCRDERLGRSPSTQKCCRLRSVSPSHRRARPDPCRGELGHRAHDAVPSARSVRAGQIVRGPGVPSRPCPKPPWERHGWLRRWLRSHPARRRPADNQRSRRSTDREHRRPLPTASLNHRGNATDRCGGGLGHTPPDAARSAISVRAGQARPLLWRRSARVSLGHRRAASDPHRGELGHLAHRSNGRGDGDSSRTRAQASPLPQSINRRRPGTHTSAATADARAARGRRTGRARGIVQGNKPGDGDSSQTRGHTWPPRLTRPGPNATRGCRTGRTDGIGQISAGPLPPPTAHR